ncbi:M28 family peptidase [Sphingobacterium sp. SRCM116780]|uniref:M28 family peptidase n=1 Tax=Sphingobacterium sp. SRCM116780 TaxID=2907623 RepID=UPI001F3FBEA2|nr:M28 family peptidase [Sphingobacterium sp. SRCM116780]UIR55138.1 M28 family peptidase [Sphingobacterium sp. SRCM116780]
MKKFFSVICFISSLYSCAVAQNPAAKYANAITEESTRKHLTILASVDFEGRGTGQKGGRLATEYIANEYKKLGLTAPVGGKYFQPVSLLKNSYQVKNFTIAGRPFVNGQDLLALGNNELKSIDDKEIIFIGYGIDDPKYSDIKGLDLKDKIVLLLNDKEPVDENGKSIITGTTKLSEWSTVRNKKIKEIMKHHPKLVLAYTEELDKWLENAGGRATEGRFNLAQDQAAPETNPMPIVVNITDHVANYILNQGKTSLANITSKINRSQKPQSFTINTVFNSQLGLMAEQFTDPNVMGYLEGTDLKNELIVIGGHYDHDGKDADGTIFPGADDNASGTTAVLELAKAFSQAKAEGNGPRRSILFITYAAEEKGLLGSKYYTENPIFPLNNTVTCINIDMIGRIDNKHLNGNHQYIHSIGADKLSSELSTINKEANEKSSQLELDFMYDDPKDPMRLYYRSDHYNFASKGIPSIFYFSGLHPDYHTPDDTVDKIDFPIMVKREKFIFQTAWDVANRDTKPAVDSKKD